MSARVFSLLVSLLFLSCGAAAAADAEHVATAAAGAAKDGGEKGAVDKLLEECRGRPSVVHAGAPLSSCMEGFGYEQVGDTWVKKPPTR